MAVQKYGRTTGQTFGTVLAVNVTTSNPTFTVNLPFTGNPVPGVPKATAANTAIEPIRTDQVLQTRSRSALPAHHPVLRSAGDSGALVVDMSNEPPGRPERLRWNKCFLRRHL